MKVKHIYLISILLYSISTMGQQLDWYQETWSDIRDIVVSEDGLVTVAGTYHHSEATVNGVTLNTFGADTYTFDPFVARYSSKGDLMWVKTGWLNGYGFKYLNEVATDTENSAIVIGYFKDELRFCDDILTPESQDIFVAKYNEYGDCLWSKRIGGVGNQYAYHVKTDLQNNIYISCSYGSIVIDGQSFDSNGSINNRAIIKLDENGTFKWLYPFQGNSITHIDVSDQGEVFIAGDSQHDFEIDSISFSVSYGGSNQYVIKLQTNGSTDWIKYIDSPNFQGSGDIIIDDNNHAYVRSIWYGDVTIDNSTITTSSNSEKLMKISNDGNIEWIKEFLGQDSQCHGPIPRLTITNEGLPCLGCAETEIIDSENYQNYDQFGLTYATFDPSSGDLINKKNHHDLRYYGKINFDKYGAIYSKGGKLQEAQFNGSEIPPPNEGSYIYKLEGEFKNIDGEFLLYPNPTSGKFKIQLESKSPTSFKINIYDLSGKIVYTNKVNCNGLLNVSIDGERWAQGVYQINISSSEKSFKGKVVKN